MTISPPSYWKESFFDKGPKYDKIIELIDAVNVLEGSEDHGNLAGLADDDHTQYLLADATRAVAGNLVPDATNTRDLGTSSVKWKDIYLYSAYFAGGTTYKIDTAGVGTLSNVNLFAAPAAYKIATNNVLVVDGSSNLIVNQSSAYPLFLYGNGTITIGRPSDADNINVRGTTTFNFPVSCVDNLLMQGSGTADKRLRVPYLTAAPGSSDNGSIWMESDGLHIVYGGAEKVVAGV